MMVVKKITCPVCSNDKNSIKVSDIYIQSLVRLKNGDNAEAPIIDRLQQEIPEERRRKLKGSRYYRELMESFAPPQGEGNVTRTINPDMIAVVTGLFSLYFLFQIFTKQYFAFWYVVILEILVFSAYIIFHKQIKAKFISKKTEESSSKLTIEKAVGYWMKLYYCIQDNVVFSTNSDEAVPIDKMRPYLLALVENKK
jgi:hypothetical protein